MHQMAQHPSASSQMEFSGMSSTNNISPHFSSVYHNFDQTDHTLTNRVSQHSEKSLGMPVLAIQNANYNRMYPTSRINCIQQTQPLASFASLSCDVPLEMSSYSTDTLCANEEESTLNRTETENPKYFASHFSLPSTSQNSVTSQEYRVNNRGAVKFKEDENYPKNKQWTDFSYGLAENISYNSRASQIHQHNFEGGIKNSKIECHTWEHSNFVTSLSENKNACKISNTISASEVSGNLKKISENKTFCRKACALKKLDVPQKPKTSYNCSKCPMTFRRKDYHESHECCHNVEKPYVCNFYDKAFSTCRNLGVHIMVKSDIHVRNAVNVFFLRGSLKSHLLTHTVEKPYTLHKCSKGYSKIIYFKRDMLKHAGEERSKCDSCGAEFSSEESLGAHKYHLTSNREPSIFILLSLELFVAASIWDFSHSTTNQVWTYSKLVKSCFPPPVMLPVVQDRNLLRKPPEATYSINIIISPFSPGIATLESPGIATLESPGTAK
ncbi:hypothetical protein CEXT_216861 [Caerostris extrusa]|uniref:C2H2-type domain-containing protein n=1 Tax=Caerostris extrusa TaxID=172846 RepID=A0AAV4VFN9_CAEEX|nr:hypothetical protein CEXT_216861 [Caerostris extrusa]